ncbi:copper resistance CopC family protein [Mycolicibacterium sp. CH28]|uniref:copper resistance CopC family protein n=1 Tax=Mycolicibacterium sp. CH28 TaxID=2512237 RepID=UPI001F349A93|nr:copper resistance CopC family protein [Mycolicibacterium sp. CH28]
MNLTMRTVVATLIALAFLPWGAGVAAAHTALVGSDPAGDAQISTPVTAVVLTFSENINPAFANVVVRSADGHDWVAGQAIVEGPRLTAEVGPQRLPNGAYTVGYRVVSADGHPVSGSYSFTIVGPANQPPPPTPSASPAPSTTTAPPPAEAAADGPDTKTSILTAGVAGLALGGVIAFWQSRKRRRNKAGDSDDGRP